MIFDFGFWILDFGLVESLWLDLKFQIVNTIVRLFFFAI
jgi:hypothetical protein